MDRVTLAISGYEATSMLEETSDDVLLQKTFFPTFNSPDVKLTIIKNSLSACFRDLKTKQTPT